MYLKYNFIFKFILLLVGFSEGCGAWASYWEASCGAWAS